MAVVRNIIVRVGADTNSYTKKLKQAQNSLKSFSVGATKSTGSFAAGFINAKTAAVAAAAAIIAAMAAITKYSITAAAKAIESENLFAVSLGEMTNEARAWSKELQKTLGLNAYEIRKNVGTFYNMTTSMGIARKQAYGLSTSLTQLAYDMASFYNISFEEALNKLQSGITGETEPLQRLGILVKENTLKQYALQMGIKGTYDQWSEQTKVLIRYKAIMEQTKNAQGDLARTIKSPMNQWRVFNTQLELAAINLGNALMPIVEAWLPILVDFAKTLAYVTEVFAQFSKALFGNKSAQAQNAASAASAQVDLGDAIQGTGDKIKKSLAPFDEINQLTDEMAVSTSDIADALGTNPPITKPQFDDVEVPKWIKDWTDQIKKDLAPSITELAGSMGELSENAKQLYTDLEPLRKSAIEYFANRAKEGAEGGIESLTGAMKFLNGEIMVIKGIKEGDFDGVKKGFLSGVMGAAEFHMGYIKALTGIDIKSAINQFAANFVEFNQRVATKAQEVGQNFSRILTGIIVDAVNIWNILKDEKKGWPQKLTEIKEILIKRIETFKLPLADAWDKMLKKIAPVWDTFKLANYLSLLKIRDSIVDTTKKFTDPVKKAWKGITDGIKTIWEEFKKDTKTAWDNVKNGIKDSINSVIDNINRFIDRINGVEINIPGFDIPLIGPVPPSRIGLPKVPKIPRLQEGTLVSHPTLAEVGHGPEVVMPLKDTSFVDTLAGAIGKVIVSSLQFAQPSGQAQSSGDIIFNIDGAKFARIIRPYMNNENTRSGKSAIIRAV